MQQLAALDRERQCREGDTARPRHGMETSGDILILEKFHDAITERGVMVAEVNGTSYT